MSKNDLANTDLKTRLQTICLEGNELKDREDVLVSELELVRNRLGSIKTRAYTEIDKYFSNEILNRMGKNPYLFSGVDFGKNEIWYNWAESVYGDWKSLTIRLRILIGEDLMPKLYIIESDTYGSLTDEDNKSKRRKTSRGGLDCFFGRIRKVQELSKKRKEKI